jgi:hypothetical protein
MKTGRGLPELSRSSIALEGLSLSATWHPAEILKSEGAGREDGRALAKAAWEHLQWLRGLLPPSPGGAS